MHFKNRSRGLFILLRSNTQWLAMGMKGEENPERAKRVEGWLRRITLDTPRLAAGSFIILAVLLWGIIVSVAAAQQTAVRVRAGDSLSDIAGQLKAERLISSTGLFKMYSFIVGAAHRFQPGRYQFRRGQSLAEIIGRLEKGPEPVSVVINEGLTAEDIDVLLAERGILERGELARFLAAPASERFRNDYWFLRGRSSLEGFLFPDTYRFIPGAAPETVLRAFADAFSAKAAPLLSGEKDWYTILTLASILEKEVASERDRVLVAGILRKRLTLGMPLQVDATVTYLKCGGAFVTCADRRLTKADFKIDSPYNTYLRRGLPPGPIANPGLSAINAALNPRKSDHLFYLSDPRTRATIFARTFDEHSGNRFQYLKQL